MLFNIKHTHFIYTHHEIKIGQALKLYKKSLIFQQNRIRSNRIKPVL